jgi:hypothetical protein
MRIKIRQMVFKNPENIVFMKTIRPNNQDNKSQTKGSYQRSIDCDGGT